MSTSAPVLLPVGTVQAGRLHLTTKNARVKIRREARADISVTANRPEHWSIDATGSIRQTKAAEEGINISIGGNCNISIGGDLIGSVIGGGLGLFNRVRQVVSGRGSVTNLTMNDTEVSFYDAGKLVRIPTYGLPTSVVGGEVYVNGQKVYPKPESDAKSDADGKPEGVAKPVVTGPDLLEIAVPNGSVGDLILAAGDGSVTIESDWHGGDVTLHADGDASITAANLTVTGRCNLRSNGDGAFRVGDIAADSTEIRITDDGSFYAGAVSGRVLAVEMTGDGGVTLSKPVNVTGAVAVHNFDDGDFNGKGITAASIEFDLSADGNITPGPVVSGGTATVRLTDDGSFKGSELTAGSFGSTQTADGGFTLNKLDVAGAAVFSISDDGGVTIKEQLNCGSLQLTNSGDAPIRLPGALKCSGGVQLTSSDDGRIDLGVVHCQAFSSTHDGDGGLTAAQVTCDTMTIVNRDDASITIRGGAAKEGSITNTGDSTVRLVGDFANLTRRNTGDGKIRIG